MDKAIVLIDDTITQKDVLQNLVDHLRKKEGISANGFFFNPNDRAFWNEEKDPDINLLISEINNKLIDTRPSLIIVDQYYSDIEFNGLNVIENLRSKPKFRNCEVFLYSGNRDRIVREIFLQEDISEDQKIKNLAKIINYKISQFLDKEFKSEAVRVLKKVEIKDVLPNKLRAVESKKIHLFSPRYKHLTMAELADKIESNDPEVPKILDEMFDLTISHYIAIDEGIQ